MIVVCMQIIITAATVWMVLKWLSGLSAALELELFDFKFMCEYYNVSKSNHVTKAGAHQHNLGY